jgi:hypothetical protein
MIFYALVVNRNNFTEQKYFSQKKHATRLSIEPPKTSI